MGRDRNTNKKMDHKEARIKHSNLESTVTGLDPKKPQNRDLKPGPYSKS